MSEQVLRPGMYRHFKGGIYEVLGVAEHSERPEEFVVYKVHNESGRLFVRPKAMFLEVVRINGEDRNRFEYIGIANDPLQTANANY